MDHLAIGQGEVEDPNPGQQGLKPELERHRVLGTEWLRTRIQDNKD